MDFVFAIHYKFSFELLCATVSNDLLWRSLPPNDHCLQPCIFNISMEKDLDGKLTPTLSRFKLNLIVKKWQSPTVHVRYHLFKFLFIKKKVLQWFSFFRFTLCRDQGSRKTCLYKMAVFPRLRPYILISEWPLCIVEKLCIELNKIFYVCFG